MFTVLSGLYNTFLTEYHWQNNLKQIHVRYQYQLMRSQEIHFILYEVLLAVQRKRDKSILTRAISDHSLFQVTKCDWQISLTAKTKNVINISVWHRCFYLILVPYFLRLIVSLYKF